jgi:hypothetical protein
MAHIAPKPTKTAKPLDPSFENDMCSPWKNVF